MNTAIKRGLSILMAICLVLGMVVVPNATPAKAAAADILSTPTYANTLDKVEDLNEDNAESTRPGNVSGHSENLPLGWTFKNNNSRASSLKEAGGRTYWQMKTAADRNSATFASYQFQSENNKNLVLSYDFMTDCEDEAYVIQLPIPAANTSARTMDLRIENGVLYFDGTNYSKTLTKGEWYHIDLVCAGDSNNTVKIYINDVLEYTKANHYGLRKAETLYYLNMSLGSGAHAASVTMNLDDLAVCGYVPNASFGAAQSTYTVAVGATVATQWKKTEGAYLPGVTFLSSNELVATVEATTGVVKGVSEGTVTIKAIPAASSGLASATVTVTVEGVAEGGEAAIPSGLSKPSYMHSMDVLRAEAPAYYPDGWNRQGQHVHASSLVTANGRTYYQMKRDNVSEGNALSWAIYDNGGAYGASVLKYDLMLDNGALKDWTVFLPTFEANPGGNVISPSVKEVNGVYQLYDGNTGKDYTFTPGAWYTVELVYTGTEWSLYITDGSGKTAVPFANMPITGSLQYINMGIANDGGDSYVNANGATISGGNVAMNIDRLEVYKYAAGTGFAFTKTAYRVISGKTLSTSWVVGPENAYISAVTYSSSDPAVATVDADTGVVTGANAGTAVITATPAAATGLPAATTTVTVVSASGAVGVTGVSVNETDVSVAVGSTTPLTAAVQPGNATVNGVTWFSLNPGVAAVDPNTGVVTGVSQGKAQILVMTDDGRKTATVEVTVHSAEAKSLVICDGISHIKVTVGKFINLYAAVVPAGVSGAAVKWSSSNPAVAAVDEKTGAVTGVAAGTAVITAVLEGTEIKDSITVTVAEERTGLCVPPILEISMDTLNETGATRYPVGWKAESTTAAESGIVTYGGRTYWQMKESAAGVAASSYAVYTFTAEDEPLPLTELPLSLKYSVMVDEANDTRTIFLPSFTNAPRGQLFRFVLSGNLINAAGTTLEIKPGEWYEIEVVVSTNSWAVYVNGGKLATGALSAEISSVAYINAGIYASKSSENLAENVSLNIDDLAIYSHKNCTYQNYAGVSFDQTAYRFVSSGTCTPILQNLPVGTSVTYASTNEAVATVDSAGQVTVTGAVGIASIMAYADGCILPIAATQINCSGRFTYTEDFENGLNGWRIYIHAGNPEYQSISDVVKPLGDNNNNHVMAVKSIAQSGNSMRAIKRFEDGTVMQQAVLRYDFMIDSNKGNIFLPGFVAGSTNLVAQLNVSYGNLLYRSSLTEWAQTDVWFETDTWYALEQVVDTVAGVFDLYIDGKLVLAQQPINDYNAAFDALYVGMFKISTDTLYVDNLYVREGIDPVTAISFAEKQYQVSVGTQTIALKVDLTYTGETFRSVKFTSSDPSIATVDAFGNVTGHKVGTVTITATPSANPALSATTTVTVTEVPVTGIEADNISLHVGGHRYINPTVNPGNAGFKDVLYTTSNASVATVDEWGEVVAIGTGTAQITITAAKYPTVKKTITVTVSAATYQSTIYVSVNGGGDGSSKSSPLTLAQAMAKVAAMDKSKGSIVVELAGGYYQQTEALNFLAEHGGSNDHYVIYRAAQGEEVTIGGAEILDDEIVSGFTKVEGANYYVMQLDRDINTRHLIINGVRAIRARSKGGLTDPKLISPDGLTYTGFSCTDTFLLDIPADDHADLEFSYHVEWANHRGGADTISLGEDGRVQIIMEQPNFQTLVAHSNISINRLENPSRPYSMFYENALILLDEPGEWYFDNEEMKLYYMPYAWENVDELTVSYPVIDDWTKDGMDESESGLVNILGGSGIVQNIRFEGITFADTTYSRTNSNMGMSASQGMHIRDFNSTSADTQPDAAITLARANSIYFTGCTFTRLGITGINMLLGTQNAQIVGCVFSDISGNGMYIGQTNFRNKEIYNPSNPLMIVKNCDVYNSYMHDMGTEYQSASAIGVGFAAYVNLENNEVYNVAYSPFHIGLGWTAEIDNVLRHTTVANNFIHDFNFGGVWDSGGIYVNGTTSGNLDPYAGTGNNIISGNYLRNMGVGTSALYNDGGSDNWIWEYNVVDLSETPLWPNAWTPNGAQWTNAGETVAPLLMRYNYTSTAKTRRGYPSASGKEYKISAPYNEDDMNDNDLGIVFKDNQVVEDLNWPTEARNIMAAAGLTEAYAHLRSNHPERLFTDLPDVDEDVLVLAVNASFNINLRATDGKDNVVDLSKSTIAYVSSDTSVIAISDSGVITATGKGDATVYIHVMTNGIVQTIERQVSVGTDLVDIYMDRMDDTGKLSLATNGEPVALKAMAVTERGVKLTPDSVQIRVLDSSVAELTDGNIIKPLKLGETTIEVTVTFGDATFTRTFAVEVVKAVDFELDDLEEIFQFAGMSGWVYDRNMLRPSLDAEKSLFVEGFGTGFVRFSSTEYLNELFCFEFAIHAETLWPSLALRTQGDFSGSVAAGETGYLISFTPAGIQLQRFNRFERTVLYGDVVGFDSVFGGDIPVVLKDDQIYKVQLGALTNGTSVRLYLSINGVVIFDCVDNGDGAITDAGYFGVVGKKEDTFWLIKATDLSDYTLPGAQSGNTNPDGDFDLGDEGGSTDRPTPGRPGKDPQNPSKDPNKQPDDGSNVQKTGWILPVSIAAAVIVAGGIVALVLIFQKKKKQADKPRQTEE